MDRNTELAIGYRAILNKIEITELNSLIEATETLHRELTNLPPLPFNGGVVTEHLEQLKRDLEMLHQAAQAMQLWKNLHESGTVDFLSRLGGGVDPDKPTDTR